jgi:hypothetical protein
MHLPPAYSKYAHSRPADRSSWLVCARLVSNGNARVQDQRSSKVIDNVWCIEKRTQECLRSILSLPKLACILYTFYTSKGVCSEATIVAPFAATIGSY